MEARGTRTRGTGQTRSLSARLQHRAPYTSQAPVMQATFCSALFARREDIVEAVWPINLVKKQNSAPDFLGCNYNQSSFINGLLRDYRIIYFYSHEIVCQTGGGGGGDAVDRLHKMKLSESHQKVLRIGCRNHCLN